MERVDIYGINLVVPRKDLNIYLFYLLVKWYSTGVNRSLAGEKEIWGGDESNLNNHRKTQRNGDRLSFFNSFSFISRSKNCIMLHNSFKNVQAQMLRNWLNQISVEQYHIANFIERSGYTLLKTFLIQISMAILISCRGTFQISK